MTNPSLPHGQGELVLVVDDENAIRRVVERTLTRFGYEVVVAAEGAEAVAIYTARRLEIAVVLTDMAMPIMDGPATIRALRAINPEVRIIGSSGHASSEDLPKAEGTGALHFVPKPYTTETLLNALQRILRFPL